MMTSVRIIIGIIWVSILLVCHAIWTVTALPSARASTARPSTTAISQPDHDHPLPRLDRFGLPRLDRFGNEVERAVGDYRLDDRGDIYEQHAPDTAVLELAPPSL